MEASVPRRSLSSVTACTGQLCIVSMLSLTSKLTLTLPMYAPMPIVIIWFASDTKLFGSVYVNLYSQGGFTLAPLDSFEEKVNQYIVAYGERGYSPRAH